MPAERLVGIREAKPLHSSFGVSSGQVIPHPFEDATRPNAADPCFLFTKKCGITGAADRKDIQLDPGRVFCVPSAYDSLFHGCACRDQSVTPHHDGEPILHAANLAVLSVKEGETIVHIGAGTGYYTAVLSRLTGPTGSVIAYEIEPELAQRAAANLADLANVTVCQQSGSTGVLPSCDVIYVNAGATGPLDLWLDALRPGGRLLFPLTPAEGPGGMPGAGGMLLVTQSSPNQLDARFLFPAAFISCAGARDEETAKKLSEAFKRGDMRQVQSLRRKTTPDETCWCSGNGWWLSTAKPAA